MVEVFNTALSQNIAEGQATRLQAYNDDGDILWTVFNDKIVSILVANT